MSDVVLVLGMHRSGTSAVAGAVAKLGGGVPKHLMPAHESNSRGFFESVALMRFHDELLASAGSDWSDWRPFNPGWIQSPVAAEFRRRAKILFAEEFEGSPLPILKDPRICRFPAFWLETLREMSATPHIAMPIRSPLDVAQSLKTLHGLSLTHGLLLWLRHVLDAEAQTRSTPRSIFSWNEFQSDWRGVCDKIALDTNLSWPRLSDRASLEIDRFLSKDLVHHDTDDFALGARGDVHQWVLRVYEALLELRRNPFANSALATLDDVRLLLDDSSQIFGRLLIDGEMDLEQARSQSQAAFAEIDALRHRQNKISADQATALAEFSARSEQQARAREQAERRSEALSQALAAALAERDGLVAAQAEAVAEFSARSQRAERAREQAERQSEALSQALAAALAEREALAAAQADAAAEVQSQRRALEESQATLSELAARSRATEAAFAEATRDRDEFARSLAVSSADLQRLREALAKQSESLIEHISRAQGAKAALDEAAQAKDALAQSLVGLDAARAREAAKEAALAKLTGELRRERDLDRERAEAQAKALAEAQRAHETRLGAIRTELVDAEAEAARARAEQARKGVGAFMPARVSRRRIARRLLRGGLFDAEFYRRRYPEAIASAETSELAAATHYVEMGFCRGYLPNPLFDTRWYLEHYADVRHAGVNPLLHYLYNGWREGRDPGPEFQTNYYLESNPDVRVRGVNPLAHYLSYGRHEGRLAVRLG